MKVTAAQTKRTAEMFNEIAKEPMSVEFVDGVYYAFGSEIATLRLFYKYNCNRRVDETAIGYSENIKSHYFLLETPFK